jgi:hypothetical protein
MAKKTSKLVIDNEELTQEFFEDARLIGVVAPLKGYQFCGGLNETLRMKLNLSKDIGIELKKKTRDYFFDVYEYHEPTGSLSYFIYNNKSDGEFLLPEFKHLDFLLLMKGDSVSNDLMQQFIGVIKVINGVQLVVELTNEKIRNKENLVF